MDIVVKLAKIDLIFPEESLVIVLLSNLLKSYESFIVAIETRNISPTQNTLKVKLTEESYRKRGLERNGEGNVSEEAYSVRDNGEKAQEQKKRARNSYWTRTYCCKLKPSGRIHQRKNEMSRRQIQFLHQRKKKPLEKMIGASTAERHCTHVAIGNSLLH